MATLHGLDDPEVQVKMQQLNAGTWDPRIDRNLFRTPERMIHVFSVSQRAFVIDRAPLWVKFHLRACPSGQRYTEVAKIPDPMMQAVHSTETGRKRGEAIDGLRCAIDLLNPSNPTNNPDWQPSPEMAGLFGTSTGCDLFAQGLFVSLNEVPAEAEIVKAEQRRSSYYRGLVNQARQLESLNRADLEKWLQTEGTDVRLAMDFFGETADWHKPMIATRACPNCGEQIKTNVAFHLLPGGVFCVNDWQKAVDAGVKTKSDVPEHLRWWDDEIKRGPGRPRSSE